MSTRWGFGRAVPGGFAIDPDGRAHLLQPGVEGGKALTICGQVLGDQWRFALDLGAEVRCVDCRERLRVHYPAGDREFRAVCGGCEATIDNIAEGDLDDLGPCPRAAR